VTLYPEIQIGLEVHMQLAVERKLFSTEKWQAAGVPNTQLSALTLGLPGSLPVVNTECVELALGMADALGCGIATILTFDRKHYVYPDLPKGYQITQQRVPLGVGGIFPYRYNNRKQLAYLQQLHLEEDAGKIIYDEGGLKVDYNRAGVPLAELVTLPCFSGADEVVAFLKQLQIWMQNSGISTARMETGGMRCDVNVSIAGDERRCEIKNLNSFQEIKDSIDAFRQLNKTEREPLLGFTLSYDVDMQALQVMRLKIPQRAYRYMPEFDIPDLSVKAIKGKITGKYCPKAFPWSCYLQYCDILKDDEDSAWFFASHFHEGVLFDILVKKYDVGLVKKMLKGPYVAAKKASNTEMDTKMLVHRLGEVLQLVLDGRVFLDVAYRHLLPEVLADTQNTAEEIARTNSWVRNRTKVNLLEIVEEVLEEFPEEVQRYKAGKLALIGFFIGKVRARSQQQASPAEIRKTLLAYLCAEE